MTCPICAATGEDIVLENENLRVITVHDEPKAPAFCRVIWREHVAEMTDLSPEQRNELMNMVYRVEAAMRQVLRPRKMNLASLGNVVPHLHWHVIARFDDDACFPAPIWANAVRSADFRLPEDWVNQVRAILLSGL
ncbi:HIT family protein [Alysiella crassa]|uniref:HIT domain n=1 Tax=Alysiella crassa TaxID=153491 RepID=A0A376BT30_9NEIS|nr:HIT domain-containing protein [Alysiella crassa]UOP08205.1 HIT domain-containing protein [Alysiella crassa]SSY80157.1 HIT domain [Alysiella crassa]